MLEPFGERRAAFVGNGVVTECWVEVGVRSPNYMLFGKYFQGATTRWITHVHTHAHIRARTTTNVCVYIIYHIYEAKRASQK